METKKHGPHGEYCGCDPDGVYIGMGCPNPNRPLEITKHTAMYDFMTHIREMKNQLMKDWQNQRADYYMVRILEGLELKAYGFLTQEKEQIEDAYRVGKVEASMTNEGSTTGEQYYNETYGE